MTVETQKYRSKRARSISPRVASNPVKRKRLRADHTGPGISRVSTVQFVCYVLAAAIFATLYVGHVNATDDLMRRVQVARQTNLDLNLRLNRLKGEYDRLTAPDVIYPRASALGLIEGYRYGTTIFTEFPPRKNN